MKRTWSIAAAAALSTCLIQAQDLNGYLAQRKKLGITNTVSLQNFNALIGTKKIELRVTIKGSIISGDTGTLFAMVEDSQQLSIDFKTIPEWASASNSKLRVIALVERSEENSRPKATLIAAVPEAMMAAKEASAPKPKPAKPQPNRPAYTPSRSGSRNGRPAPMQGTIGGSSSESLTPKFAEWNVSASEALPYYVNFIKGQNPRLSDTQATRIAEAIIGFSLKFNVDSRLIVALIIAESSFNPNSKSHTGAMGLGQLMPGTARELGVSNAWDTTENIYGTVKYLAKNIDSYTAQTGDDFQGIILAIAAYNAGPGAVQKHGGIPPYRETQNYVRKVSSIYRQLCGG